MSSPQVHADVKELLNRPAGQPPVGAVPNFHNPPNLDTVFVTTATLCASVAALAVLIRSYTKSVLIRSTAYEDYIIVVAFIGEIGFIVTSTFILKSGGGIHMWDLQLRRFFQILYWLNILAVVYGVIIFLIKLFHPSPISSYICPYLERKHGTVRCNPHRDLEPLRVLLCQYRIRDRDVPAARKDMEPLDRWRHCFDTNAPPMATGIFNIISDFAILVLPIASIWKDQMPLRKKLMVAAIFATGISAWATSIVRTVYTWKIIQTADVSYNILRMGLWTAAEMTTGILVSCLPIMPRFFQNFGPKIYDALSHNSKALSGILARRSGLKDGKQHAIRNPRDTYLDGSAGTEMLWDGYSPQSAGQGNCITLDRFEMAVLANGRWNGVSGVPGAEQARVREGKEAGYHVV